MAHQCAFRQRFVAGKASTGLEVSAWLDFHRHGFERRPQSASAGFHHLGFFPAHPPQAMVDVYGLARQPEATASASMVIESAPPETAHTTSVPASGNDTSLQQSVRPSRPLDARRRHRMPPTEVSETCRAQRSGAAYRAARCWPA